MSEPVARWIYGDQNHYAILETPSASGWVPPPLVGGLRLLGTYWELFTLINRGMTQSEIAERFATSQQSVSRWTNAQSQPLFSPPEWQMLVDLYLEVGEPAAWASQGL